MPLVPIPTFMGYDDAFILPIICIFFAFSLQHALEADNAGVSPIGNFSNNSSHWDLGGAFFFAGTVITTIGMFIVYFSKYVVTLRHR